MAGFRSLELSEKRPLLFSLRLIIKSEEPRSLCVNLTRIVDVETIVTGWKMLRECERDRLRIGIDAGRRIHDFAIGGGDAGAGQDQVRSIQGHACCWLEQPHLYPDFAPATEFVCIRSYPNRVVPGACIDVQLQRPGSHSKSEERGVGEGRVSEGWSRG